MRAQLFLLFVSFCFLTLGGHAGGIDIVAAENFYGSVAQEVAGPSAHVISIMSNPNEDPHEFQPNAASAKALLDAQIVIYNGLGYDTWVEKILATDKKSHRLIINVAQLLGARVGANPHLWYDPKTMPRLADELALLLKRPQGAIAFSNSMKPLLQKIRTLQSRRGGVTVTATEPLFNDMAAALGFQMLNEKYQYSIMNDITPSFEETVAFEESLVTRKVKLLFQNAQTSNPSSQRMVALAQKYQIPVIYVTETQPASASSYVAWMLWELEKIDAALSK